MPIREKLIIAKLMPTIIEVVIVVVIIDSIADNIIIVATASSNIGSL